MQNINASCAPPLKPATDKSVTGRRHSAASALAGTSGALAALLAGRLAKRGFENRSTAGAMAVLALSFLGTGWTADAGLMALLIVFTVLLDTSVQPIRS